MAEWIQATKRLAPRRLDRLTDTPLSHQANSARPPGRQRKRQPPLTPQRRPQGPTNPRAESASSTAFASKSKTQAATAADGNGTDGAKVYCRSAPGIAI